VGVIAAALWYFLRDPLPNGAAWAVAIVAGILIHLAYAALTTGRRREGDLRLLRKAGEPPADGKRVALVGTVKATEGTLRAPISGAECVAYSYEIYHFVEVPRRNRTPDKRRVPDFAGVALAPSVIHTPQGDFRLLAFPFLNGFPRQTHSDSAHLKRADDYVQRTTFEKTTAFIGELAVLDRAMRETEGALKKDWRMSDAGAVTNMTADEQCLPPDAKVCAFGIYSAEKQSLVPDTASDSRALLLLAGDAQEGAANLASSARVSRRVGIAAVVPAIAVVAFILLAPWNVIRATPGGSLIVDKQTERLRNALMENDLAEIAAAARYLDPNVTFEADRTPLMYAKSAEAAEILLRRGASLAAHDVNGYSVLMNAAQDGSPELLTLLVSRGADVNERLPANPETTALSLARESNTPAAVDALLTAGARDPR
jgi:hypothetical protein